MNVDISTRYLGMELSSPVVASCSPLTGELETLEKLADSGAGAVVLPSLFEEEVEAEELEAMDWLAVGEEQAEFSLLAPEIDLNMIGPGRHVQLVKDAKNHLEIPVIASVNGYRPGGWSTYAAQLAEAGADAIELNLYSVNTDAEETADQVEARYLEVIETVTETVSVPVTLKLSQHFTSLSNFARRAVDAGACGLVLFNRFYGAEIDLEDMSVVSKRRLSTSDELRFPLRWIGILRSQNPGVSLAATSGVHTPGDVLKAIAAGADVACTTSAVLENGPEYISELLDGVISWLVENEYDSVRQLCGSMSAGNAPDPSNYERAHYMSVLTAR